MSLSEMLAAAAYKPIATVEYSTNSLSNLPPRRCASRGPPWLNLAG
jgi:hypothetical protein